MAPRSLSPLSTDSEDGEKVTTTHRTKNTTVDPSARPSSSSSRTSRPAGMTALMYDKNAHFNGYTYRPNRSRSRSRSPFRHNRSRSRSRSPYRANRDTAPPKRSRQEDHYGKNTSDSRRHKPYEERPARGHGSNNFRNPNPPLQSRGAISKDGRRDRGSDRRRPRDTYNDRDRSRSPYRAPTNDSRPGSRQGPDSRANDPNRPSSRGSAADIKAEPPAASRPSIGASGQIEPEEPETKKLSEAELIEQRRQKRAAIRQKHGVAPPGNDSLRRSALEGNLPSSAPTPQTESASASQAQSPMSPSSAGSPGTPGNSISAPTSPAAFPVLNEADMANPLQVNASMDDQGQAAADYDANQGEDRPEFKQQKLQEEALLPEKPVEAPPPKKKAADDFDMFAEDDDDMFADDASAEQAGGKQGRALDESMLDNWDYPDGHYRIINGELLDGRYAVQQQVGKGTFATVVRAIDAVTSKEVAIKIACQNDTMLKAGQKEMQFLERLNEKDPEDKRHIIRLLGHFSHKGHLCLVFEGLDMDLRELLKKFGRDVGISLEFVRMYAWQMFHALLLMRSAEVLHADLKPDNILVTKDKNVIKVCDFGTATLQQDAEVTPYLVSRFYRAPEVILGVPFDYAIDMWAIGCTLFELYIGRILFNGSDNNNMLRVIQECRGKLPVRVIKKADRAEFYFDDNNVFYGNERDKMTGAPVRKPMHFGPGVPGKDLKSRLGRNVKMMNALELQKHNAFVDLLEKCLTLDPEKRIKPKDAMQHPFFAQAMQQAKPPKKPVNSTAFRPTTVSRGG